MTSSVRVLTTSSLDSTPSILIIAPQGDKILVNAGEGCQRAFLEASGIKLKSVKRICMTRISAVGGLPGMLLTAADANETAHIQVTAAQQEKELRRQQQQQRRRQVSESSSNKKKKKNGNGSIQESLEAPTQQSLNTIPQDPKDTKKRPSSDGTVVTGGIEIHGPIGTHTFVSSLRHFMRRDRFEFRVKEGAGRSEAAVYNKEAQQPKRKKKKGSENPVVDFCIRALAFEHKLDDNDETVPIQSYIFQTPPLVGRFRPDRAAELGIPKGPLYAQLKNGKSVTFVRKDGEEEVTVHSHEVLEAGQAGGVAVAVIDCPSMHVLQQLIACQQLASFQGGDDDASLDVVVHLTPLDLVQSAEYQTFVASFAKTDHIWLDTAFSNEQSTPFEASSLGVMMRSMVHETIYPAPLPSQPTTSYDDILKTMTVGTRHLEYTLIPRGKRGITKQPSLSQQWQEKLEEATKFVRESGAIEAAKKAITNIPVDCTDSRDTDGAILFTGTGSALPCKHRNVTGICLTLGKDRKMLLDCGEGTVGQLLRSDPTMRLETIQVVWISHPHADHHLGILRLLADRDCSNHGPLLLIAPPNMFQFLAEYETVDPSIRGCYIKLDCYDLTPTAPPLKEEMKHLLKSRLGISSMTAVLVSHCRHSFAVVMDCDSLGRVAYSGDCRPSMKFADQAIDTDILIHEATFEDGMEEEAVLKKHSTVGEALSVGHRMKAKKVLLTHFSQRYPRIPPLLALKERGVADDYTPLVVFAFDFMELTPATIPVAARLTDALRLLYPEEDGGDKVEAQEVDAKKVLAVPGMFAKSELL